MSSPPHDHSPAYRTSRSLISPRSYTLAGALPPRYPSSEQHSAVPKSNQFANCPQSVCLYTGSGGDQCSQIINCSTVVEHFRVVHEIPNISSATPLRCGWQDCGQTLLRSNYIRHIREHHLKHDRRLGHTITDQMGETERMRESPSKIPDVGRKESDDVQGKSGKEREDADPHNDAVHVEGSKSEWVNPPPDSKADKGLEDPGMQSDTLQIERSDSGSHAHTQEVVGEERESADPHSDSVLTERNRFESGAFSPQALAKQDDAELQNESAHSEGNKLELMVLPPGEAGAERGDPATGSYSLEIGNVLGSYVFRQGKVGEERGDADSQSSSREKNESALEVFRTGDAVTERDDPDQQSHPSHLQNRESRSDACETNHSTTNSPSVATQDSISDSSVRKFRDNRLSLSPGPDLEPRKTGLISKLSKFFQRRKSSQGTQEKKRTSPEILRTAPFNEPVVVTPGKSSRQVRQRSKTDRRCHSISSVNGSRHSHLRHRDGQSNMDTSLYQPDAATPTTENSDGQISDDEHSGCCCVCYFKAPRSRRARCRP
ncbi:hypothetical protein F5141DRAFT_1071660 [Pisolithus sp. B1]|nr:hypothetical protein F5141DRAFT_1071660 [Pisolithus sp. B1]